MVDKVILALTIIPTVVSIFAIVTSTENIWNAPDLDVQISQNEDNDLPVDDIVRVIYNEPEYKKITAENLRKANVESLDSIKSRFSADDSWIIDRVYFLNSTDGLSEKITILNKGSTQAQNVIIQILGTNNFKIIDHSCPEIMSNEQISKEHGKKYVIVTSRLSVQLPCDIIINSVGDTGVNKIIVTADESDPAVWPDDVINHYTNLAFIMTILGYSAIVILVFVISYNLIKFYKGKIIVK